MRIRIITLLSLLHLFAVYSQSEINIYDAVYGNVFHVTFSVNDVETGQLLEQVSLQTVEFISGTNGLVKTTKTVLWDDMFHFVDNYYDLVDDKLIFISDIMPIIKGREFSLDPASTSQNLLWTTQATIKGKSIQMTYHLQPHTDYASGGVSEADLIGTWRLSSITQGDRTQHLDENTENALLQMNEDQSFTGFGTSGDYIRSDSGHFLILDNQKNTNEITVMQICLGKDKTLEVIEIDDYKKTIMRFIKVK